MPLNLAISALLPFPVIAFLAFNRLVTIQHTRYRDAWFSDGRPRKLLRPRANGEFDATVMCFWKWLTTTPDWVRGDGDASRAIVVLRSATVVWNVGALALLILSAVS